MSDSVTPWTVAHQAPLSIGFSWQESWIRLPLPSPGDLPNSGIETRSPALQADSLPSEPPGKLIGRSSLTCFSLPSSRGSQSLGSWRHSYYSAEREHAPLSMTVTSEEISKDHSWGSDMPPQIGSLSSPLLHMRVQAQADPLAYITSTGTHEVCLCISAWRGVRINNEIKLATAGWIIVHIILPFSCPRNTGGMFKHLSLLSTEFSSSILLSSLINSIFQQEI